MWEGDSACSKRGTSVLQLGAACEAAPCALCIARLKSHGSFGF